MADADSSDQSSPRTFITAEKQKKRFSDDETDEDEDGKEILGSAGGIVSTTPQISRARMLSEQKELSLKKRQNSTQKGMIRAITLSEDSSDLDSDEDKIVASKSKIRVPSDDESDDDDDEILRIRTTISNRRLQHSYSDYGDDHSNASLGDCTPNKNHVRVSLGTGGTGGSIRTPRTPSTLVEDEESDDHLEGVEELGDIERALKANADGDMEGTPGDLKWGIKRDVSAIEEREYRKTRSERSERERERYRRERSGGSRRDESADEREKRKRRERKERERRERERREDRKYREKDRDRWERRERERGDKSSRSPSWKESERRYRDRDRSHDRERDRDRDRSDSERRERRERREREARRSARERDRDADADDRRRRRREAGGSGGGEDEDSVKRRERRQREKRSDDEEYYSERRRKERHDRRDRDRGRDDSEGKGDRRRAGERERGGRRDNDSKRSLSDISDEDDEEEVLSRSSASRRKAKDNPSGGGGSASLAHSDSVALLPLPLSHLDLLDKNKLLLSPVPKSPPGYGLLECNLERVQNGSGHAYPTYTLTLKENNQFLMCAQKCPRNKTSNYHISKADNDLSKYSPNYLGKLRGNFLNTEYQLFDNGRRPDDLKSVADVRKEVAAMIFTPSLVGSVGPRKIQVSIPLLEDSEIPINWTQQKGSEGAMMEALRTQNLRNLSHFVNKAPRWSPELNAYVLSFGGRVSMTSVKNFQLVSPNDPEVVLLQFGRVSQNLFTLDFQWPFSPFQVTPSPLSSILSLAMTPLSFALRRLSQSLWDPSIPESPACNQAAASSSKSNRRSRSRRSRGGGMIVMKQASHLPSDH